MSKPKNDRQGAQHSLSSNNCKGSKNQTIGQATLEFFSIHMATRMEAEKAIGHRRESLCKPILDLIRQGEAMVIGKRPDKVTGHLAGVVTCNKAWWPKGTPRQLSLFDMEGFL